MPFVSSIRTKRDLIVSSMRAIKTLLSAVHAIKERCNSNTH